jgi:ankyrin repeat protein
MVEYGVETELSTDLSMISTIAEYGFDINMTNKSGKGSALAAASTSENLELVRHIHGQGADVCTLAVGNQDLEDNYQDIDGEDATNNRRKFLLENIGGMAALHVAVRHRNIEVAAFLISAGADVNQLCYPYYFKFVPIQLATYYGSERLVKILLDAGADPDFVAGESERPDALKHPYASEDPYPFVTYRQKQILDYGQIVGRPSLRIALETGNSNIFNLLLSHGASMPASPVDGNEWDPVASAVRGGNPQLVRTVLQHLTQPDVITHETLADCITYCDCKFALEIMSLVPVPPEEVYCVEVLQAAVKVGDIDFVRKLLRGARSSFGELPAGYSAAGSSLTTSERGEEMLHLFLKEGIKPYERSNCGRYQTNGLHRTSFVQEVFYGLDTVEPYQTRMLEHLIDKCELPDINSHLHDDWKHSMFAACSEAIWLDISDPLKLMIGKGVDIDWHPPGNQSLLNLALVYRNHKLVGCLLDLGANADSRTLLHQEAHTSTSIFERLLQRGADIHAKPGMGHGMTPLQWTAMYGSFDNLRTLLKLGANINESPGHYDGRTAIEGAAEHGRLNMVSYLLAAGADVRGKQNKNYRRTIYRAWKEGHGTVVRVIQEWKTEKYGQDDCEDARHILESMTFDELFFKSTEAKAEYVEWERLRFPEVSQDVGDWFKWQRKFFQEDRARLVSLLK